ncbi:MAG: haloacid dehalogenase type II [Methylocella sp.]
MISNAIADAGVSVNIAVGAKIGYFGAMAGASPHSEIKALFFDVFGTLVDWRSGVAAQAEAILAPLGYALDWPAFADAWRGEYQTGMEEIRSGRIPFSKLDFIHRRNLDRILPRFGLAKAPEAALAALNLAWHKLDAWPDAAAGLARLRGRYILAPMSNGNVSLIVELARHNGFCFDAIFGAEFAGDYKPKPRVYLAGAEALDLPPSSCLMVAAHSSDLAAAARCGLRTAHIARPDEYGPGGPGEASPSVPVDLAAADVGHLAALLGL